jgi:hypothetical protein
MAEPIEARAVDGSHHLVESQDDRIPLADIQLGGKRFLIRRRRPEPGSLSAGPGNEAA